MDEQKQQLIERIRQAQNVLVTVSANPSVDQLAAAIGLTLALNKLDKHCTAVFSGQVPNTIEFLKPEETLEKDTNSLRDFIIALDKSKADKLRYKVEDQVVRIFITPYRTSLSEADLNFSQGDFNVDVVIALGVTEQQDLDAAITAHGRILHDATVASVTTSGQGTLGTINWVDPQASSLSEMVMELTDGLDKKVVDNQIATALLTGIVATTDRFRNERTSPRTMSASARLMEAGANQQLIATQLETPPVAPIEELSTEPAAVPVGTAGKPDPGTLEIAHDGSEPAESASGPAAAAASAAPEDSGNEISVDENGGLHIVGGEITPAPVASAQPSSPTEQPGQSAEAAHTEVKRGLITDPPKLGETEITASAAPEEYEPSAEELTLPAVQSPLLSHSQSVLTSPPATPTPSPSVTPDLPPPPAMQPAPSSWQPPEPPPVASPAPAPATPSASATQPAPVVPGTTLTQIEQSVDSPHVQISDDGTLTNSLTPPAAETPVVPTTQPAADSGAQLSDARSAVQAALNSPDAPKVPLPAIDSLNAMPLGPDLRPPVQSTSTDTATLPAPAPMPAPATQAVLNPGFSEPTPGGTPADATLDMPVPSNPFGPGRPGGQPGEPGQPVPPAASAAPPVSAFPGAPAPSSGPPPPPVPPPLVPPVQ